MKSSSFNFFKIPPSRTSRRRKRTSDDSGVGDVGELTSSLHMATTDTFPQDLDKTFVNLENISGVIDAYKSPRIVVRFSSIRLSTTKI